ADAAEIDFAQLVGQVATQAQESGGHVLKDETLKAPLGVRAQQLGQFGGRDCGVGSQREMNERRQPSVTAPAPSGKVPAQWLVGLQDLLDGRHQETYRLLGAGQAKLRLLDELDRQLHQPLFPGSSDRLCDLE